MKNRILVLVGLALLAGVSAYAQNQETVRVDVPFAFRTGNQLLPAGRYEIQHMNRNVVRLQGPGGVAGAAMVHLALAQTAPKEGYILFRQIGNRYFLGEIWSQGQADGDAIAPGPAEREALAALKSDNDSKRVALNTVPTFQSGQ
jgi:hypothetical protein